MRKYIKTEIKTRVKKESDTEMLARLMADGFGRMNKSFEDIDKRFEYIDKRFDHLEKKFDDRCDRIEYILMRAHDNRLERLEDKMRKVETTLEMT